MKLGVKQHRQVEGMLSVNRKRLKCGNPLIYANICAHVHKSVSGC